MSPTSPTAVQITVIGRGMIGAAAARHAAESGSSTALIGPDEPTVNADWPGPFNSHCDEGRITRLASRSAVWATMARRSIDRYDDIATRSGIDFHTPRAVAVAFPDAQEWADHAHANGGSAEILSAADFRTRSGIRIPGDLPVALEGPPGGHINPRRMVAAQTRLAELAGATIIRETATSITGSRGAFEVSGSWGSITAEKVLLATGAFGSDLLDVTVELERRPRTVVMAEFDDGGRLPSLILHQPKNPSLGEIYWVPPVRYPDGRLCLKIGGEMNPIPPADPDSLRQWFQQGGGVEEAAALKDTVCDLLPDVEVQSWWSTPCVVTNTRSGHPMIGWVDDGLAVALGGNGSSAKSSDEIGRLAAQLTVDGEWTDDELSATDFTPALVADSPDMT